MMTEKISKLSEVINEETEIFMRDLYHGLTSEDLRQAVAVLMQMEMNLNIKTKGKGAE